MESVLRREGITWGRSQGRSSLAEVPRSQKDHSVLVSGQVGEENKKNILRSESSRRNINFITVWIQGNDVFCREYFYMKTLMTEVNPDLEGA